jgi:predicted TIM-barrel fold metal-dependent hydrolase
MRPNFTVPAGTCDCHVHIFGSHDEYPLADDRVYMPSIASVADMVALHDALGVSRTVIVQASPQGTDNRRLVDALNELHALGRQGRGVAVIDASTRNEEIAAMHRAGVRGVRVNLQSTFQSDSSDARRQLREAAERVAPLGWHVQIYTGIPMIASLRDTIMDLPVPVVVDHYGIAKVADGAGQAGFQALLDMVAAGKVYVKLSGAERISDHPRRADASIIGRPLIDANPERMLWATDWPHTGGWPGQPRMRDGMEPFHPRDDGEMMNEFARWTTEQERHTIFVENPARLYQF